MRRMYRVRKFKLHRTERWHDDHRHLDWWTCTWPCTDGMITRPDGDLQIA